MATRKNKPGRATRPQRSKSAKPKPTEQVRTTGRKTADEAADLYGILQALAHAISVIRTAKQSLEHRDSNWDEIVTLEAAIKQLRRVDVALNDVADGRPSRITTDEDDDTTDDEEGAE